MATYRNARKSIQLIIGDLLESSLTGAVVQLHTQGSRLNAQGSKANYQQGRKMQGSKARPKDKRQTTRGKFSFSVSRQNFSGFLLGRQLLQHAVLPDSWHPTNYYAKLK